MHSFARRNAVLLLLALLGLLGLATGIVLQGHSFPVAQVEFHLLGPDAEKAAREYLQARGFDTTGYQAAVAFDVDDTAKGYVERQVGLAQLNRLAAGDLNVWRWRVRFFRELQEEEFSVYLSPNGRPVGFSHQLPEAAPGGQPEQARALANAGAFLRTTGRDPGDYALVTASAEQRPARTDFIFTWERKNFHVADASYRVDVWTQGDDIGGYFEYLKVPEAWQRAEAMEANRGGLLANLGWTLTYGLGLLMALVGLWRLRSGRVHWRFALSLAGVMVVIAVAVAINSFPLVLIDYPTTSSMSAYLLGRLQSQLLSLLPTGMAVVLAGVAGDWLYSQVLARRLAPHLLFSRRGLRSREFVTAVLAGYAVAGIWLGYVTGFYTVVSSWFHAWSPAELPYRDVMTTLLPALYPLTVGFGAAVSEEFAFRLFAVPLLLWLARRYVVRSAWARRSAAGRVVSALAVLGAIVVPAFVWGSLHSTYPQQPFFIRAVEVGIIGCLEALLMFRFGILATVTAHYTYNACVIGGLFLLSPDWYLRGSALFVVLLPLAVLLPAAAQRRARRPLYENSELAEAPVETTPVPFAQSSRTPGRALWLPGRRQLRELAVLGAVCAALALAWQVPRLGDGLRTDLDASQAAAAADSSLRQLGLDPGQWDSATSFGDWSVGNQTAYLLRRLGTTETNRFLQNDLPSYLWQTRYFRPEQKEEISVRFDQLGRLQGLEHTLAEDAPGAHLSQQQALALAEAFAHGQGKDQALRGELVTAASLERPARTDYSFEWETRDPRLGEATLRLRITIAGDQIGSYGTYLKVPEAFNRALASRSAADQALDLLRQGLQLAVFFGALALFALRYRRGQIDPRFAAASAGLMAGLSLLGTLNGLPTFWTGYWTTVDAPGYIGWRLVWLVQGIGGNFVWYLVLFGVGESLFRELFPDALPVGQQLCGLLNDGRPALAKGLSALAMAPALWLLLAAYRWAREAYAAQSLVAEATVPAGLLNTFAPALEVARANLSFSLWVVLGALPTTLWLYRRLQRRWAVALVWVFVLTLFYGGRPEEWRMWLVEGARWLLFVGLVYLAARRYLGENLGGYVLALYTLLAGRDALSLLQQDQRWYWLNGTIALALALAPGLLLILVSFVRQMATRRTAGVT